MEVMVAGSSYREQLASVHKAALGDSDAQKLAHLLGWSELIKLSDVQNGFYQ